MRSTRPPIRRPARLLAALAAGAAVAGCADLPSPTGAAPVPTPAAVAVWLTTADGAQLLAPQPPVPFDAGAGEAQVEIEVDEGREYQTIAGFGAAVTGSAAHLIRGALGQEARAALMRSLFDPREGIGLSFVRTPMGASDFSLRDYTYADLPVGEEDWELRGFSIEPDRAEILPVLREARALNPELKVMATPWSPPAWMKTSRQLAGGSLRPEAYGAYAEYFRRFLAAYAEEGIPVYAVTVQNEPRHEAPYPSMRMSPAEQAAFVRDHLGPTLAAHGHPTRILAWDHNWDGVDFALDVFRDAGAAHFLAGAAFHCYAGDVSAQSRFHEAVGGKEVHFTECSGGAWSPDFAIDLLWNLRHLVIGATRNWSRSVLLWNLALDPRGGPTNRGCSDCRGVVTIDPATGEVARNVEYYALGHVSRWVRPGAVRIASTDAAADGLDNVAFRNPDGTFVLVALNPTGGPRSFRLRSARGTFRYLLPPGAAATFVWR